MVSLDDIPPPGVPSPPGTPPPPQTSAASGLDSIPPPKQAAAATGLDSIPSPAAAPAVAHAVPSSLDEVPPPGTPSEAELKEQNRILPSEIAAIAARHGVDPEHLKMLAPYLGAYTEETAPTVSFAEDAARRMVGIPARALVNLPKLASKLIDDKATQQAVDELDDLVSSRRTFGMKATEFGAQLALGGGMLKGLGLAGEGASALTHVKTGAALGAAAGASEAKEGQELHGAEVGGMFGGALGSIAGLLSIRTSASPVTKGIARQVAEEVSKPEVAQQIEEGGARVTAIAEGAERPAPSEAAVGRRVQSMQELPTTAPLGDQMAAEGARANAWEGMSGEQSLQHPDEALKAAATDQLAAEQATQVKEFAGYLKAGRNLKGAPVKDLEEAEAVVKGWGAAGRGTDALRTEWTSFRQAQIGADLAADEVARRGGLESNAVSRFFRGAFRARAQAGIIDDRAGSLVEPAMDGIALADNAAKARVASWVVNQAGTMQDIEKGGLNALSASDLADLEKGAGSLTAEQAPIFDKWKQALEGTFKAAEEAKGAGAISRLEVPEGGSYIPKVASSLEQRIATTVDYASRTGLDTTLDLTDEMLSKAQAKDPEAYSELLKQLTYVTGDRPSGPVEIQAALRQAANPELAAELENVRLGRQTAGSFLPREEQGLPDSFRETNLNRILLRYQQGVAKDIHLADPVSEMVKQRNLLQAAGDRAGVEYVDRYLADLTGPRTGVPAVWAKQKAQWTASALVKANQLEASGNKAAASTYRALANNSDIVGVMGSSLYPNLLGAKPSTVIKALVTPMVTALPEMAAGGWSWAGAKMAGASMATAADLLRGKVPEALAQLKAEGWMPTHMGAEALDAFRSGMERSLLNKAVRGGIEKYAQVFLAPLQMAEAANRILVGHAAESIAKEYALSLTRGESSAATRYVEQMGRGYAELVRQAGDNPAELARVFKQQLISKTLQHYSPTQMSEWGRWGGRLLGAMSTWPSATAGDIVRDVARKGVVGALPDFARKQLAPLGALWAMQHYLTAGGFDPASSPRAKALVGSRGLAGMSPLPEAAGAFMPRSVYLDQAKEAGADLLTGDPSKWARAAGKVGGNLVPFTGMLHLLDTTIPALTRDQAPQGRK